MPNQAKIIQTLAHARPNTTTDTTTTRSITSSLTAGHRFDHLIKIGFQPVAKHSHLLLTHKHKSKMKQSQAQAGFLRPRYYRAKKTLLPESFTPPPMAVLLGRGRNVLAAKGNALLKKLVKEHSEEYKATSNKQEKSVVVSRIIDMIHDTSKADDRDESTCHMFLKYDENMEQWWEVSTTDAREKISSLFRDSLAGEYKSSVKAKVAKRKAKRKELVRRFLEKRSGSSSTSVDEFPSPSMSVETKSVQEEVFPMPLEAVSFAPLNKTTSFAAQQQSPLLMATSSVLFGQKVHEPKFAVPPALPLLMATSSYLLSQAQKHNKMLDEKEEGEREFVFPAALEKAVSDSLDKSIFGAPAALPLLAAASSMMFDRKMENTNNDDDDIVDDTPDEIGSYYQPKKRLSFSNWEASWNSNLNIYIPDPVVSY